MRITKISCFRWMAIGCYKVGRVEFYMLPLVGFRHSIGLGHYHIISSKLENPVLMEKVISAAEFLLKLWARIRPLLQNIDQKGTVVVEGRTIKWKTHGRVHSLSELWVWDGEAKDVETGLKGTAKHYKGSDGAMKHAIDNLTTKLKLAGKLI